MEFISITTTTTREDLLQRNITAVNVRDNNWFSQAKIAENHFLNSSRATMELLGQAATDNNNCIQQQKNVGLQKPIIINS